MLFSGRVSGIWPYDFGTYDLRTPGLSLKSVGEFSLKVGPWLQVSLVFRISAIRK